MPEKSFDVNYTVRDKGGNTRIIVDSDIEEQATLEELLVFAKKALIGIAVNILEEEVGRGRFPADKYVTVVDNKKTKNIFDVRPFGKISFVRAVAVDQIIVDAYDAVVARSPIDTGLYAENHAVFLDRKLIAMNKGELMAWIRATPELKETSVIRIVNLMPYAGFLERRGITSTNRRPKQLYRKTTDKKKRSGEFIRKPNGVYTLAYRSLQKKYKNNTPIRFEFTPATFLDFSRAPKVQKSGAPFRQSFAGGRAGSRKKGGPYVYPTLTIRLKSGGGLL